MDEGLGGSGGMREGMVGRRGWRVGWRCSLGEGLRVDRGEGEESTTLGVINC